MNLDINMNLDLEFVTIAYKKPYYLENARIYYDNKAQNYVFSLHKGKFVIYPHEFKKGEVVINGEVWKYNSLSHKEKRSVLANLE